MSAEEDVSINGKNFEIVDEDTDVVVGTSATRVLKNNPNRIAVIFSNLTANDVVLRAKNDLSLTKGYSLDPLGGLLGFKRAEEGTLPSREWYAIASAGSTTITVTEIIKIRGKNS